jgi:hypothetical protein
MDWWTLVKIILEKRVQKFAQSICIFQEDTNTFFVEVCLFRDKTDPALQDETYIEVKKSGCCLWGRIVRGQNMQGRNVGGCNIQGRVIPV